MDSDDSKSSSSEGSDSEQDGPASPSPKRLKSKSKSKTPQRNLGPASPRSNRSRSSSSSSSDDESPSRRGPRSPRSRPMSPKTPPGHSRSPLGNPKSPPMAPKSPPMGPKSPPMGPQSPPISPKSSRSAPRSPKTPGSPTSPTMLGSSGGPQNTNSVGGNHLPQGPKSPPNSDSDDNRSRSSKNSRKPFRKSRSSSASSSQKSRSRKKSEDGSSSDSSVSSVDSSSRKNKNITKPSQQHTDNLSEGDISDNGKQPKIKKEALNDVTKINPEDLSDVSDLDDSIGGLQSDENSRDSLKGSRKNDDAKAKIENGEGDNSQVSIGDLEKDKKDKPLNNRHEDGEEQLDFEAEDGECEEPKATENGTKNTLCEGELKSDGEADDQAASKPKEDLEEGEVTDEDEPRPEETEPRPVCRFFSRGACTWGASCRFLHPGVTDKGNYTMFDMVRPLVPEFGINMARIDERMYPKIDQPVVETAWERGLRTAKEMLRKSMKRKEQDIDFEEKKMNLSIAQEEFDKENGYYGRLSPTEPRYVRVPTEFSGPLRSSASHSDEYYGRRQVVYDDFAQGPHPMRREHARPFREPPPAERIPHHPRSGIPTEHYTSSKYEETPRDREAGRRGGKSKREVIVQRAPEEARDKRRPRPERPERPESRRPPANQRPDEWSDPWMRSKGGSPGKDRTRKRSYSSGSSSYSSSSSRSSSESSKSSRSPSLSPRRRPRLNLTGRGRPVSPSIIVSERKAASERAALMNPPAPKRKIPSPGMMRVTAANPPAPIKDEFKRERERERDRSKLAVAAALAARVKRDRDARKSSRSSSGSSSGSSSDSDSSSSSSSSSRSPSPKPSRKASDIVKAIGSLKNSTGLGRDKIKLNLKTPTKKPNEEAASKKRAATSPAGDSKSKKATSRREELLKQLKAVEDAIAKKRSKV